MKPCREIRKLENGRYAAYIPKLNGKYFRCGKGYDLRGLYNLMRTSNRRFEVKVPDEIKSELEGFAKELEKQKEEYLEQKI